MGKVESGEKKVRVRKKNMYKNWGNTLIFMQNKVTLLMHMITIYLWFYSYIRRHILILMILILVLLVLLKFFYKNFITSFLKEIPSVLPPIWGIEHQIDFVSRASIPNWPAYRSNFEESKKLQRQVEELMLKWYIQESISPCIVPLLHVWF
jgi:hypothetical protein